MIIILKLAVRNFLKNKVLNSLNVIGLAMGITAAILIVLYADHEYGFDNFHLNGSNVFRMEGKTNGDNWFSNLGMEHGKELTSGKYPEVISKIQLNSGSRSFLKYQDKRFAENNIYRTNIGSEFFEFFEFNIVEGNPKRPLTEPYATVLTKSTAEKYFGNLSPIGEFLEFDTLLLKVTAVVDDLPTNSHLKFDMIYADPVYYKREHFHTQTYLRLGKNTKPNELETKILAMKGVASNEFHELSSVQLMPVKNIHLNSDAVFGDGGKGDELQLIVFLVIGGLILLISLANYVNLSLAIFLSKGREVGIRKVLGESRNQILKAFIVESLLMTMLTLPIIILGLVICLPYFNEFLDVKLGSILFSTPIYWLGILGFIIIISLITIAYPALTLGNAESHLLMKSKSAINLTGGVQYRNALIFIQFILLFTLGISAFLMNRQINFLDDKDVGFNAEGVIKIENAYEIGEFKNFELFKSKLLSYPQIEGVAFGPMMGDGMNPLAYKPEGTEIIFENLLSYGVDIDYFEVMGMEITTGDFKSVLRAAKAGQIVSLVNESFINRYGWADNPIGKKITLRPGTENELDRKVSAVFKDFHFYTLKEKITPHIISLRTDPRFVNTNILIRTNSANIQYVIKIIEDQWYEIQPNLPMKYELMSDSIKKLYARERQTGQLSMALSVLAIALSILGLVGFMIYIISLRSKEIAIHKVLGASLLQIINLLNRRLFLNILIAAVFGSAMSYYLIVKWLEDFAYAIKIEYSVFIMAIIAVYGIVFIITGFQSLKSTQINPVKALKDE